MKSVKSLGLRELLQRFIELQLYSLPNAEIESSLELIADEIRQRFNRLRQGAQWLKVSEQEILSVDGMTSVIFDPGEKRARIFINSTRMAGELALSRAGEPAKRLWNYYCSVALDLTEDAEVAL